MEKALAIIEFIHRVAYMFTADVQDLGQESLVKIHLVHLSMSAHEKSRNGSISVRSEISSLHSCIAKRIYTDKDPTFHPEKINCH